MKTLFMFLLIALCLALSFAYSQDVVSTNQVTVEWDPTTTTTDGNPIPTEDVIAYEMFRAPWPVAGDLQDPDAHENLGTATETYRTVTFTAEGDFALGVRAIRDVGGGGLFYYSEIIWSHIDGVPRPFIVRYYGVPIIENIRLQ